jgi:hypothetical protein
MADELWIVSDTEAAGWCVAANGKVATDDEYPLGGGRVNISVSASPLTEKQAFAIRDLICDLRKDGVLEKNPAVGVQYPQRTTVDNVKQSMPFLHCWPDNCDEEWHSSADIGVSEGLPWVTPEAVEPPDQLVHQGMQAQHDSLGAARDERRAAEPAAGVTQGQQSKDSLEGDTETEMNQMVLVEGMEGSEVEAWQGVCNEVLAQSTDHDYVELLITDGVFGTETTQVTAVVQTILGVPPTGKVDEDTWVAVL